MIINFHDLSRDFLVYVYCTSLRNHSYIVITAFKWIYWPNGMYLYMVPTKGMAFGPGISSKGFALSHSLAKSSDISTSDSEAGRAAVAVARVLAGARNAPLSVRLTVPLSNFTSLRSNILLWQRNGFVQILVSV